MSISLGATHHGSWNLRQGSAGVGGDVSVTGTVQAGWITFPQLILPQYDQVMEGGFMYVFHLFRQSGVDDNGGWITQHWLAQPMRLSGGGKAVYWQDVLNFQAPFSSTRYLAYSPISNGTQTSNTGSLNGATIADSTGPNYLVIDCNYDTDGSYKWKGTFSRM